jgi:hypothetical protein
MSDDKYREGQWAVDSWKRMIDRAFPEEDAVDDRRAELDRQARVIASPYIKEEREACAKLVEDVVKGITETVNIHTTTEDLRKVQIKVALLKDIAAGIRARGEDE